MSKPEDLPDMEYRYLGRSGLQVSAISLGGWLTYGGHVDREGTYACMKAAYDAGINFFDCAEGYADGESERVMGEAIKKFGWKRNDLVISTKIYFGAAHGTRKPNNTGLSRKHILEGITNSLCRLQLDYVDLIYAHRPDRNTPLEETAWRYADKLNLIGQQPRYNLPERQNVERALAHLTSDPSVKLGLTTFSPLKQGILSGKYKAGGHHIPPNSRFTQTQLEFIAGFWKRTGKEEFQATVELVSRLEPIAAELNISLSVLALAWVLANPNVSSAITGASSPE
ncbi:NADP-dependent oxidoreductase domain-containing protein [Cladorrhinum sp. PSN259]|nr:NADP-dependent oxidoreductase domain-containing protein [Cladorrhinum sp. PSN259]